MSPCGLPPPPSGVMQFQKKVWFHTWAALLNTPALAASPAVAVMISSSGLSARSVPSTSLLRLSTYALWCLP